MSRHIKLLFGAFLLSARLNAMPVPEAGSDEKPQSSTTRTISVQYQGPFSPDFMSEVIVLLPYHEIAKLQRVCRSWKQLIEGVISGYPLRSYMNTIAQRIHPSLTFDTILGRPPSSPLTLRKFKAFKETLRESDHKKLKEFYQALLCNASYYVQENAPPKGTFMDILFQHPDLKIENERDRHIKEFKSEHFLTAFLRDLIKGRPSTSIYESSLKSLDQDAAIWYRAIVLYARKNNKFFPAWTSLQLLEVHRCYMPHFSTRDMENVHILSVL